MILRTKTTKSQMNLKMGDEIELVVSNVNNTSELVKVIVKVTGFIKEPPKCSGCGIFLKGKKYEYQRKLYCGDCLTRRKQELSAKQMGHPQYNTAFGGTTLKIGKGT